MSANIERVFKSASALPAWHGLGVLIDDPRNIDAIAEQIGAEDYQKCRKVIQLPDGRTIVSPDMSIVRMSDLRVIGDSVSSSYEIHQPKQVLEFFRDFLESGGMEMEWTGFLDGGRRMWALAKIGKQFKIGSDELLAYCLVSTSFDGSLATIATDTNVCVVCANTDAMARDSARKNKRAITIRHTTELTADIIKQAKEAMGLCVERFEAYTSFMTDANDTALPSTAPVVYASYLTSFRKPDSPIMKELARRTSESKATTSQGLYDLMVQADGHARQNIAALSMAGNPWEDQSELPRSGQDIMDRILRGPGADQRDMTAWKLHSGVTDYVDHVQGRNADTALSSAWFGQGANLKAESQNVLAGVMLAAKAGA